MLAVDTNVVVRYLTGDHPEQSAQARAVIDGYDVFVSDTVMLESEWVLRSAYGFAPVQVSRALRAFAGLARVSLESPEIIGTALDHAERGMDFADALHLARAGHCDGFITFDRAFIKAAKAVGIDMAREP